MPIAYDSTSAFLKKQLANFKNASDVNYLLRAAAVESVTLIQDRVQQSGRKSDGTPLPKYSNRVYKGARRKAKAFASKKRFAKTKSGMGYRDLRQSLGLQVDHMDFTFSGDMWKSWRAIPIKDGWAVVFGSKKERRKSDSLEGRFGRVFFPAKPELNIIFRMINRQAINALSK